MEYSRRNGYIFGHLSQIFEYVILKTIPLKLYILKKYLCAIKANYYAIRISDLIISG